MDAFLLQMQGMCEIRNGRSEETYLGTMYMQAKICLFDTLDEGSNPGISQKKKTGDISIVVTMQHILARQKNLHKKIC